MAKITDKLKKKMENIEEVEIVNDQANIDKRLEAIKKRKAATAAKKRKEEERKKAEKENALNKLVELSLELFINTCFGDVEMDKDYPFLIPYGVYYPKIKGRKILIAGQTSKEFLSKLDEIIKISKKENKKILIHDININELNNVTGIIKNAWNNGKIGIIKTDDGYEFDIPCYYDITDEDLFYYKTDKYKNAFPIQYTPKIFFAKLLYLV